MIEMGFTEQWPEGNTNSDVSVQSDAVFSGR